MRTKLLLVVIAFLFAFNSLYAFENSSAIISAKVIQRPIFKRTNSNSILLIKIDNGENDFLLKNMDIKLSKKASSLIKRIELFSADTAVESSVRDLIYVDSSVSKNLKATLHHIFKKGKFFLWVNVVLKDEANIDNKIEFTSVSISDSSATYFLKDESGHSFSWKLGTVIRKAGEDDVNTYRIPGIITTDKKTLVAVYDARYKSSKDLPGNIDVGMSRSVDGGLTWQPMKIIMDMGEPHDKNGIGDPCVLFDKVHHKIWVAAMWSKDNHAIGGSGPGLSPDESGQFVLVNSEDDGITWSKPINITTQIKNPKWTILFQGPGSGIMMHDGTLVFPAQYWDEKRIPFSTIVYSKDFGKSWTVGVGAKSNTTESQVIETENGTLMLNMRDNRGKFRSVAVTKDLGKIWIEHKTSYNTLQDPVCMASIIKADDGNVFFSNVNHSNERKNMTIKASKDLAESWLPENQLLIDERTCFGYSCLTMIDKKNIGLIYEGIKDLYFVRIPVKEIIKHK